MDSALKQSTPKAGKNNQLSLSIAQLSDSIDQLLRLDALDGEIPFWQHPKWWQLANDKLFDGTVELVSVTDNAGNTLAALPIQRIGGLLRSPQHEHLSIGECIWCASNTGEYVNDIMDELLNFLNAWAWQSTNSPDHARVRLCENQHKWQWRMARQSASFDTTGDIPIPGKLRRNLSRHERKLETTHGATQYSIATHQNTAELSQAMNTFLTLEAAGWKGQSGTAINDSPTLTSFYQGMVDLQDENLQLEIHQQHLGERCIASQLAFLCGNTRYLLKICYDEEYAAFSPGSLLLKNTLQHCVDNHVEKLSLVTAPMWAMRWKPTLLPVWHVTRYANTVQGNMRHQLSRARRGVIHHLRESRNRIQS